LLLFADTRDRHGVYGQVSGRVVSEIGNDGAATDAEYEAGQAPEPVRRWLEAVVRRRRIEGYWGRPGQLVCEYVRQYVKGAQVISYRRHFRRH
jgi:hypothetical protein